MAHFAVKYQLNNVKDYEPLWAKLAKLGGHKATKALYLVDYEGSAQGLANMLTPLLDSDDMLLVAPLLARPATRKCYVGTADWIAARF